MAMSDYGSVVKKNGKIIQKEFFMDMKEMVGFVLEKATHTYEVEKFNEEGILYKTGEVKTRDVYIDVFFFSYIGDEELLVCIYKGVLVFVSHGKVIKMQHDLYVSDAPYEIQKLEFAINNVKFRIKRLDKDRHRYKLRFWYKGDLYEVLYGYGVDINKNIWYNLSNKEKRYIDKWFNEAK